MSGVSGDAEGTGGGGRAGGQATRSPSSPAEARGGFFPGTVSRVVFLGLAAVLLLAIVAAALRDRGGAVGRDGGEGDGAGAVESLLREGHRLLWDGYPERALALFEEVLAGDGEHPEARLRRAQCRWRMGVSDEQQFRNEAAALLAAEEVTPGFHDLVRAELEVMDDDITGARTAFDRALAFCSDRLHHAILHEADHLKDWKATPAFCLGLKIPVVEEGRRDLARLSFRPGEESYLSLFLCSPLEGVRLLFPRDGNEQDREFPCKGGDAQFVEFYRDSGQRLYLPADRDLFFVALATRLRPETESVAAKLSEILRSGGRATEARERLGEEFGKDRALVIE